LNTGNQYQQLVIQDVFHPVDDFCIISFENGHSISWKAGQYLTFVFPEFQPEVRRSYSIVSLPGELLAIGVKRKVNGIISRKLVDLAKKEDVLLTIGSAGMFTINDNLPKSDKIFFFAAGSGITPVYPLIRTILAQLPEKKISLFYSNAGSKKTVFYNELLQLEKENKERFNIVYLFSDNAVVTRSRLNREIILHILEHDLAVPLAANLFYLCGPELYMFKVISVLQERGIDKEQIRKENFVIPSARNEIGIPPDKATRKVDILFGGLRETISVEYPDSILKSARKAGITLPYSCETGRCGNCVALCVKGAIWHSNNEVLMDADIAKGLILTCTGHPVYEDAKIVIGNL
jgi:ring-1,2-phenylacetyl-CoA epoxidase subunit PaaE